MVPFTGKQSISYRDICSNNETKIKLKQAVSRLQQTVNLHRQVVRCCCKQ